MKENYIHQVELLLDILPIVMKDHRLALKGGTAINFFYANVPRLSVDIDLCYLPIEERETSFKNIHEILKEIKLALEKHGLTVKPSLSLNGQSEVRLFVRNNHAQIKVEPNFVLRGSVFSPEIKTTSAYISDKFHQKVEVQCLSFSDVFGGKIHAALSRQHPRDLFDIKCLFEGAGITKEIRKAFLVYLISSPRPIHEVIIPNLKDISTSEIQEFQGMTNVKFTIEDLKQVRRLLITTIKETLTVEEKNFLMGFKKLEPDWSLLGLEHIQALPSVRWKILNLKKMPSRKRETQYKLLKEKLFE